MKCVVRLLAACACLTLGGCIAYEYPMIKGLHTADNALDINADFDAKNYFFNTVVTNKTSETFYLHLQESYTLIGDEAIGLTKMSNIKNLDGSGNNPPIVIPPAAKISVEIANVKQTNGRLYDTWFPHMWEQGGLEGKELNMFLVFKDAKGQVLKKQISTKLGVPRKTML